MFVRVIAFTSLCLCALGAPAQVPIEQMMSAEERASTGIERLSASELAALNAWLAARGGALGAPAAVAASEPAPAVADPGPAIRRGPNRAAPAPARRR